MDGGLKAEFTLNTRRGKFSNVSYMILNGLSTNSALSSSHLLLTALPLMT